jgi:O-antigen/teichoic acid export membrane protein
MSPVPDRSTEYVQEDEVILENITESYISKKVIRWNFVFQYGYVITNIINSFVLLPLYLSHISTGVLGLWLASGNILSWMTLTDPGVGDVLQQKIAELRGKGIYKEVGLTIGSGFYASVFLFIISLTAGFIFYAFLGYLIDKDISRFPDLQKAVMISIIATALSLFSFSMSGINQGLHNSAQVAISALLANVLFLLINVVLLYLDFGVISIALANLARAIFINGYNIISMRKLLKKTDLHISYQLQHFKKFIRIFSVTSMARIIGGLSGSIDLMILARYIPAGMITVFEINKRPVKMTQSLIGRHSVALMPSVSHAKGSGNKKGITELINRQLAFYTYAVLFVSLLFLIIYPQLIQAWVGKNQYAGDNVLHLLIAGFFFGLIGYFMANMGYALGDIKRNSTVSIIKGSVNIVLLFIVAGRYGISGILFITFLSGILDFFYYSYRIYQIGYLQASLIRRVLSNWVIIIPCSILAGLLAKWFVGHFTPPGHPIGGMVLTVFLFTFSYFIILLLTDKEWRSAISRFKPSIRFTSTKKV